MNREQTEAREELANTVDILEAAFKKKGAKRWSGRELGIFAVQENVNTMRPNRGAEPKTLPITHQEAALMANKLINGKVLEKYEQINQWLIKSMYMSTAVAIQLAYTGTELSTMLRDCCEYETLRQAATDSIAEGGFTKVIDIILNERKESGLMGLMGSRCNVGDIMTIRRNYVDALGIANAYNAALGAIQEIWEVQGVTDIKIDLKDAQNDVSNINNYLSKIMDFLETDTSISLDKIIEACGTDTTEALSPLPFTTEPDFLPHYDLKGRVKDLTAFTIPMYSPMAQIKRRLTTSL